MNDDMRQRLRALATSNNPGALIRGVTRGQMLALIDKCDAATALLREARDELVWWCNAQNFMTDDQVELITHIDALLGDGESIGQSVDSGRPDPATMRVPSLYK